MNPKAATKDGLPRRSFAYAPSADPKTWALPFLDKDGHPDPDRLPASATSLTEADVPSKYVGMVKSKLRQAYRRWQGANVEYPEAIAEGEFGSIEESESGARLTIREATVLLDKSAVTASVIGLPNGDTVVIPCYSGAFTDLAKPYEEYAPESGWSAAYDAADAAELMGRLIRMKKNETDDPAQVAMLDSAIAAIGSFVKAESDEITATAEADVPAAFETFLREAGRRNSSKDSKMIQSIHNMSHELGAEHDQMTRTMHEAEVDPLSKVENVTFREAGAAAIVTLEEAGAVFDDAKKQVWITPIQPGFGNKRDNFFYPDSTLREATDKGLFNGVKMFRNHPRRSDEKELPERSVTDWFGVVKESKWDEQNNRPRALIQVFEESDWNRFKAAPDQVAFSVLGQGKVRPGRVAGKDAKVIESFTALRSVDWVTTAGAGGAIEFAESAADEEFEMDLKDMTVEQLTALKESNPTVYEHLVGLGKALAATDGGPTDAVPTPAAATGEAPSSSSEPEAAAPTPEPEPVADATPVAESTEVVLTEGQKRDALLDELLAEREERKIARARTDRIAEAAVIVKAALKETTLPKVATEAIETKFAEAGFGNGFVYTDEKGLRAALDNEIGATTKLLQSVKGYAPRATGLGAPSTDGPDTTVREAVAARLANKWGTESIPKPDPTRVWTGQTPEDGATEGVPEPIAEGGATASASDEVAQRLAGKWGSGK